jgi:hypothetical protein
MLARESRDVATANADIGKFAIGETRKLVDGAVVALPCAEVASHAVSMVLFFLKVPRQASAYGVVLRPAVRSLLRFS